MIKNYIKIALRNLLKNKVYASINVLGITISTVVVLFSATFVYQEYSYDNFHEQTEKKYRVLCESTDRDFVTPALSGCMFEKFAQIPEIAAVERLISYQKNSFRYGSFAFIADILFVDSSFFNYFNFPLQSGSESAFFEGDNVFISEEFAHKIFDEQNPIGEVLTYENSLNMKVAGVLENVPMNSHLQFDFIVPDYMLERINPFSLNHPEAWHANYYFEIVSTDKVEVVEEKVRESFISIYGDEYAEYLEFELQPFSNVYLESSNNVMEKIKRGNIIHVYFIGITSLLILIISCFNYININLALLSKRMKEVVLRKIVGADRRQLIMQLYFEAFVVSFIAVWLGVIFSEILLPILNNYLSMELQIHYEYLVLVIVTLFLVLPLSISIYPALIYTSVKPVKMLRKGNLIEFSKGKRKIGINVRQVFLVVQFFIATLIITSTIVIYRQMSFVQDKDLGYEKENRILIENPYNEKMGSRYDAIKDACEANPDVISVSSAFNMPAMGLNNGAMIKSDDMEQRSISINSVDFNYFKTIGAEIVEGRDFSSEIASDSVNALILNKAAVESLGLVAPYIGKKFQGFYDTVPKDYTLIGVVEDIYFSSKKEELDAVAFFIRRNDYPPHTRSIVVEHHKGRYEEVQAFLKDQMKELAPNYPFEATDLETQTEMLYEAENKLFNLFEILSVLSLFLMALGLIGVVLLNLDSRKKEIGIRKALGAQNIRIVNMVMNNFLILVSIGFVLGSPLTYWAMQKWLEDFTYRVGVSLWYFAMTAALLYLVAAVLIVVETMRTLRTNPIDVLKYE